MDFTKQDSLGEPENEQVLTAPASDEKEQAVEDASEATDVVEETAEETTDASSAADAAQEEQKEPKAEERETQEDAQADTSSDDVTETPVEPQTVVRYRWNYEAQRATDEQTYNSKRRGGVYTYAIVMSAFFAVSFIVLIASLLSGGLVGRNTSTGSGNGSDRIIYIREDDGESGVLTIQEIAEQSKPGIVAIVAKKAMGQGVGSGFILREDGYIATNYHVVENATSLQVTLYNGKSYEAKLVNYSAPDDLAVLKIDAKDLPALPIGNSDQVLVGDGIVVIGHPAGLEYGWSTTNGIISAINREVKIKNSDGTLNKKMTLLQTNANVNSGNSGGPMFNEFGEVIGIISMKLADGYEGMGFAIPINGAMEIMNAIIEEGSSDHIDSSVSEGRPLMGVTGLDMVQGYTLFLHDDGTYSVYRTGGEPEDVEGERFVIEQSGFFVTSAKENSDAYGKLQKGDIIFAIDGEDAIGRSAMMAILNEKSVGDQVVVDYYRNGEIYSVKITLIAEKQ